MGPLPGATSPMVRNRSTPVPPGYLKGVCWLVTFIRTAAFGRLCFRSVAAWVATSVVPFTEYQRVLELSRSSCTNDNLVATLAPFSRDPGPFAARQQSFPVQCHGARVRLRNPVCSPATAAPARVDPLGHLLKDGPVAFLAPFHIGPNLQTSCAASFRQEIWKIACGSRPKARLQLKAAIRNGHSTPRSRRLLVDVDVFVVLLG